MRLPTFQDFSSNFLQRVYFYFFEIFLAFEACICLCNTNYNIQEFFFIVFLFMKTTPNEQPKEDGITTLASKCS